MELCSILCNNLNGEKNLRKIDTCNIERITLPNIKLTETLLINYTPIKKI